MNGDRMASHDNPELSRDAFLNAVKNGYDAGSQSYAEYWKHQKKNQVYDFIKDDLAVFESHLKHGCSLLDVGCNSGDDSSYFHGKGYKVTGLDFSSKALALARQKYPDIEFLEWNILDLAKLNRKFAAIWCAFSLLHLPMDVLEDGFGQVKSCADADTVIYLGMATAPNSIEEITNVITQDNSGKAVGIPIVRWSKPDLQALVGKNFKILSQKDFKIESRGGIGFVVRA